NHGPAKYCSAGAGAGVIGPDRQRSRAKVDLAQGSPAGAVEDGCDQPFAGNAEGHIPRAYFIETKVVWHIGHGIRGEVHLVYDSLRRASLVLGDKQGAAVRADVGAVQGGADGQWREERLGWNAVLLNSAGAGRDVEQVPRRVEN